jgi:predicted DNA-binding transcriptional regulator AlpA
MKATDRAEQTADHGAATELRRREGDELLQMEAIAKLTTISVPTLRWLRHQGEGPPIFRLGRRLVAWRGDVLQWIASQAVQDAETKR